MRVWLGVLFGVAACVCAGGAGGGRTAMPALLLPDLDQRAPQQVQVVWGGPQDHLQARLAFATNVEDLGWGPLVVVGRRPNLRLKTMRAEQYVWRRSGGSVRVARVGRLHYNVNPSHQHWHLQQYIDISAVPYGDYDLVNRVNVDHKIREVSYANNDASLRIRLLPPTAPGDPPGVQVLNVCETGSQC